MKLFRFWKKSQKNHQNDEKFNDDFLVSEDKKQLEKLTQKAEKHIHILKEVDQEITQIQKSTRTLIPKFAPLHHELRQKYQWYYRWHTKPYAKPTHWLVLLLFLIAWPFLVLNLPFLPHKAQAMTYDFPRWEWQNPTPTGNYLRSVYTYDSTNIWLSGLNGTILKYNGASWSQQYTGTNKALYDISGTGSATIWAVGATGTILKTTNGGSSWSSQTSGTTYDLYSISAVNANTAWTVGYNIAGNGIILKTINGGTNWTEQTSGISTGLIGVSAVDTNTVWAVGTVGKIIKTTNGGTTWTEQTSGTGNNLNSIDAVDVNTVWAVGNFGTILKTTNGGTNWGSQTSGTAEHLLDIAILDANTGWTTGAGGSMIKTINGTNWAWQTSGTSNILRGVSIIDINTAWAVGDYATIIKTINGGSNWIAQNSGYTTTQNGIDAVDANTIWTTGDNLTVYRSVDGGASWSSLISTGGTARYGVAATSSNLAWIAGLSGSILQYTPGSEGPIPNWTPQNSGTIANLYSINAVDSNTLWAVGDNGGGPAGVIIKTVNGGTNWTSQNSGINKTFLSVDAVDANTAWTVGYTGTIIKTTNGTDWIAQTSGTSQNLRGISAVDANTAWAVGNSGTILKTINGTDWVPQTSGTTQDLYGITAINANTAWAVGRVGTILRTVDGGTTWSSSVATTNMGLMAVDALSATSVWTAGQSGAILHYRSPANATATKLRLTLSGENFSDGNASPEGTPDTVQAGEDVLVTVYATDNSNVWDKGNASYVGFTTTDPNDSHPGTIQLTQGGTCVQADRQAGDPECGTGTATFVFHTPGTWTVAAADTGGVLSSGTSSQITVTAGSVDNLYLSNLPTTLGMGSASGAVSVGVKDAYGNNTTVSGNKTVRLSTTSSAGRFAASATGPWTQGSLNVSIASGQGTTTFYYLDFATNTATITASETPDASWTDATGSIAITSGTLDDSTLNVNKSSVAVGESLTATATLKNSEGLALANRTIQLSSDRNSAEASPDSISPATAITDSIGVASFTVTPTQTGDLTLTAFDQTDNAYIPQTAGVHVGLGALSRIDLSGSTSSLYPGSSLDISVVLYDGFSNVIIDYSGTINFYSSDKDARFTSSSHAFNSSDQGRFSQKAVLNTFGEQSITAATTDNQTKDTIYINVTTTATPEPTGITSATPTPTPSPTATPPQTLLEKFAESPVAQAIAKVITPIATTVAALGLLPLLLQAFPQGFHVFASLFPALFTAASVRRRRKPWGFVFDSLSGRPLELAVVRIYKDETDKLAGTKVTDGNGRFNFLLSPGSYYLKVVKAGFSFPAKMSKVKTEQLASRFGPGAEVYTGQMFVIQKDSNISFNIALDPKMRTLSSVVKLKMQLKDGWDWLMIGLSYVAMPMMLIGALFAIVSLIVIGSRFQLVLSIIYVLLMIGFLISRRLQQTRLGLVFDEETRRPIANAIVSVFDEEYKAIRETKMTDKEGHFAIFAPKGAYYLVVEVRGYNFPSKNLKDKKEDKIFGKLYFGETIHNKKPSFLNVSIPMEKK